MSIEIETNVPIVTMGMTLEADRDSPNRVLAGAAVGIGTASLRPAHFQIDVIVTETGRTSVGAVHTGYEFFSTRKAFSELAFTLWARALTRLKRWGESPVLAAESVLHFVTARSIPAFFQQSCIRQH